MMSVASVLESLGGVPSEQRRPPPPAATSTSFAGKLGTRAPLFCCLLRSCGAAVAARPPPEIDTRGLRSFHGAGRARCSSLGCAKRGEHGRCGDRLLVPGRRFGRARRRTGSALAVPHAAAALESAAAGPVYVGRRTLFVPLGPTLFRGKELGSLSNAVTLHPWATNFLRHFRREECAASMLPYEKIFFRDTLNSNNSLVNRAAE